MRRSVPALFTVIAALAGRAEILDRIAVTVGRQVVTESDVVRDLRLAAFLDQKPVDLSGEQKRKAADRLVDQILILQEATFSRVAAPSAEDAAHLLEQVKSQFPSEAEYRAALARYQISEEELSDHLMAGLRALRFTDLRFRPEIQLSDDDLHEFYSSMVAEWRRANKSPIPAFEASRDQVERLLTDQRVGQALDRWLGARRTEIQILYREPVFK